MSYRSRKITSQAPCELNLPQALGVPSGADGHVLQRHTIMPTETVVSLQRPGSADESDRSFCAKREDTRHESLHKTSAINAYVMIRDVIVTRTGYH